MNGCDIEKSVLKKREGCYCYYWLVFCCYHHPFAKTNKIHEPEIRDIPLGLSDPEKQHNIADFIYTANFTVKKTTF